MPMAHVQKIVMKILNVTMTAHVIQAKVVPVRIVMVNRMVA